MEKNIMHINILWMDYDILTIVTILSDGFILVTIKVVRENEYEQWFDQMEINMNEIIKMGRKNEHEQLFIQTEKYTNENG